MEEQLNFFDASYYSSYQVLSMIMLIIAVSCCSKTSYDMLCRCEDVLKKLKLPVSVFGRSLWQNHCRNVLSNFFLCTLLSSQMNMNTFDNSYFYLISHVYIFDTVDI